MRRYLPFLECYSILPSRVRKLLGFVKSTLKWRLMDRKPLDKWIHDSGRIVLLGDACHPMLVRCIAGFRLSTTIDSSSTAIQSTGRCDGDRGWCRTRKPSFEDFPHLPIETPPQSLSRPPASSYRSSTRILTTQPAHLPPSKRARAARTR